jgi:protein SCO1/2
LSLSFDAANDRPGDLAAYAQRHHADARWWTVAVPASVDAAAELLERLRVVAIADGAGGYVHNGAIHLVDGRGTVRGIYDENQWREALHDARVLVRGVRP